MGKVVGPTLGLGGVIFSSVASAYDANGYTTGDKVKTGIGVLMVAISFDPSGIGGAGALPQ